jgi:hypothetical protein
MIDPVSAWLMCAARAAEFTRAPLAQITAARPEDANPVKHARALAMHLAVIELGVGPCALAQVSGFARNTVAEQAETIGDRRDKDAALDAAVDLMGRDLRRQAGMLAGPPPANDNGAQLQA